MQCNAMQCNALILCRMAMHRISAVLTSMRCWGKFINYCNNLWADSVWNAKRSVKSDYIYCIYYTRRHIVYIRSASVRIKMSQDVHVLWFKTADANTSNDYHWSFFIAPVGSTKGTKYDAFATSNTTWSYSHVPNYEMTQSVNYGGHTMLGRISDLDGFTSLMLDTPLPKAGENCQTWIKNVVDGAVKKSSLSQTAREQLGTIPARPWRFQFLNFNIDSSYARYTLIIFEINMW